MKGSNVNTKKRTGVKKLSRGDGKDFLNWRYTEPQNSNTLTSSSFVHHINSHEWDKHKKNK